MKYIDTNKYINREISWLGFNTRVFKESKDKSNLLGERIKFLGISAANIDEFLMVRVGGIKREKDTKSKEKDPSGLSHKKQLEQIYKEMGALIENQYVCYRGIVNELKKKNINIGQYTELNQKGKDYIKKWLKENLKDKIFPSVVNKRLPFPTLENGSINIIAYSNKKNKYKYSIVTIDSNITRLIEVPNQQGTVFILIEDAVKHNINIFCKHSDILQIETFRVLRNIDIKANEGEAPDLMLEMQRIVRVRKYADPIRIEVSENINNGMLAFLKKSMKMQTENILKIEGPVGLAFLCKLYQHDALRKFREPKHVAIKSIDFEKESDLFLAIKERDRVLHHPYESFKTVIDFLEQSVNDPSVISIKQTLYRVSSNSPIIKLLKKAAENGKKVEVLIELKARLDEEKNINWAKELKKSGCLVKYGIKKIKTHCKLLLVERKEENKIVRYAHISSGNYNDITADIYSDIGFFTCRKGICDDINNIFKYLIYHQDIPECKELITSPLSLRKFFIDNINKEIQNAKNGKKASIIAKVNALVDPEIIYHLYNASMEGVDIKLIVRGICCLKQDIKEAKNIRIISIVGDFLEHSRIYYFSNDNNPKYYLGSADLMPRNLDRRVEVICPIEDGIIKERINRIFEYSFRDNVKAGEWTNKGSIKRIKNEQKPFNSQKEMINYYNTKKGEV